MITVFVTYTATDKASIMNFYHAIKEAKLDEASKAERGNLQYDYLFPEIIENQLYLVEKWADKEAQSFHATLDHFKQLGALKEDFCVKTEIMVHEE